MSELDWFSLDMQSVIVTGFRAMLTAYGFSFGDRIEGGNVAATFHGIGMALASIASDGTDPSDFISAVTEAYWRGIDMDKPEDVPNSKEPHTSFEREPAAVGKAVEDMLTAIERWTRGSAPPGYSEMGIALTTLQMALGCVMEHQRRRVANNVYGQDRPLAVARVILDGAGMGLASFFYDAPEREKVLEMVMEAVKRGFAMIDAGYAARASKPPAPVSKPH